MRKFLLLLSRKAQIKYENELGEQSGILIEQLPSVNRQNAPLMLLIKAVIVFFALMGSIDCYMSGFGIAYDYTLIIAVCAAISFVCALANTRLSLTVLVYGLAIYYISGCLNTDFDTVLSGGIAITNLSYKLIMNKYKFPSVDGFAEPIADRSLTIPVFIILGAVIAGMVLAFFICRFMNIMMVSIITMMPLGLVLFFEGTPSYSSAAMLALAWIITAMVKFGGRFGHIKRKRQMNVWYLRDNIYYSQLCDGTVILQSIALITLVAALAGGAVYSLYDRQSFDDTIKPSKTKQALDYTLRDTMIIAFSNYKNYKITSYVSEGQLGFYGNVQPDFETDLKVRLVPYTTDRMYLRSYIGSDYSYKGNMWKNKAENKAYTDMQTVSATAKAAAGEGYTAKISIENAAVATPTGYMPYYTNLDETDDFAYIQDDIIQGELTLGSETEITYHPLPAGEQTNADIDAAYRDYVYANYTGVPEQLKLKLNSLCSGEGFHADDKDLEQKINNYFQNNFEYNLKSGRLPWQTDFVEYFLFESKSGVCAHFASAATLIYRSMGIPARYVEGYCIDYPQVVSGTKLTELDPSQWLTGIRPLSPYVMEAELSDYNAHAWVEIYKDGVGWVPVDPTPYVDPDELETEEEQDTSVFEELLAYFGGAKPLEGGSSSLEKAAKVFMLIVRLAALALSAAVLVFLLRPLVYMLIRRNTRDSKKAVRLKTDYLCSKAVFCGVLSGTVFIRELCAAAAELGMDKDKADRLNRLAEKALFSQNGINSEEFTQLNTLIKAADKALFKNVNIIKRTAAVFWIVK